MSSTDDHVHDPREHLARAQAYFEKKAGRPVSLEETQEWLDTLVDFYRIVERWVIAEDMEKRARVESE